MTDIVFVRHSVPALVADQPAGQWTLSEPGRRKAMALGRDLATTLAELPHRIVASSEVKAIETAQLLDLGAVDVDERFREVSKPWYPKAAAHEEAACAYLAGETIEGWEPQRDAIERFSNGVASLGDEISIVVTHGTVMTTWLSQVVAGLEPPQFWLGLTMPDALLVDLDTATCRKPLR